MRAMLAALAIVGGPVLAQGFDPGIMLGRVMATFAWAEICGYPLAPEQRHELAAAGLCLQGEAHVSNADLEQMVVDIGNTTGRDVCERGRGGYAAATNRLIEEIRAWSPIR